MGFTTHILRHGRIRGMANATAVALSYLWSRMLRRPWHSGQPISLSVEPTTSCNLRCPQCPSGLRAFTRPTGQLDPALLEKLLDEIGQRLLYMTFYFQGEPYLHPRFCELVKMASDKGIYTATSTNAHFLDEENAMATVRSGLNRLIISLDGVDQRVYEQYRKGGVFDKALDGINTLLKCRQRLESKTPEVELQFIVFEHNRHQVSTIRKLGADLGVNKVVLKTAQVLDQAQAAEFLPEDASLSRYKQDAAGRWMVNKDPLQHCWRMWSSAVMCWDGRVVPCCFDKDALHNMGTYRGDNFKEIWKNDRYRLFRAQILRGSQKAEICRNCSEHSKVWL